MKKLKFKFLFGIFLGCIIIVLFNSNSLAYSVSPVSQDYYYKTIAQAPFFSAPDVTSTLLGRIERDTRLEVTGQTDNGFYQVLINGVYNYIPAPFFKPIAKEKTGTAAIKETCKNLAEAYTATLQSEEGIITKFAIKDVTGDGIPEIISLEGREIYTYYNKRAVMIYYSDNSQDFYYSKDLKLLVSKLTLNGETRYETYALCNSAVPWGQLTCASPSLMGYSLDKFTKITANYENTSTVRNDLSSTLYSLWVAGSF